MNLFRERSEGSRVPILLAMWPKPSEANESMLLICCNSSRWFSKHSLVEGCQYQIQYLQLLEHWGEGGYSGMLILGKAHGTYTVVGVRYHPQQKQSEMVKSTMNFTYFKCEYTDAKISCLRFIHVYRKCFYVWFSSGHIM